MHPVQGAIEDRRQLADASGVAHLEPDFVHRLVRCGGNGAAGQRRQRDDGGRADIAPGDRRGRRSIRAVIAEHANDREHRRSDPDALADWIPISEQPPREHRAEHAHAAGGQLVDGAEKSPALDGQAQNRRVRRADAEDAGHCRSVVMRQAQVPFEERRRRARQRHQRRNPLGVARAQRPRRRADDSGSAASCDQVVEADGVELIEGVTPGAFVHRHHRDHGRDAKHDAERAQKGPEFVAAQRFRRDLEECRRGLTAVQEPHTKSFLSADCLGPTPSAAPQIWCFP